MANSGGGIPVTNSMFACLQLEDEFEVKKSKRKRNNNNQNQNSHGAGASGGDKKNDKKKKNDDEIKQLKQLAFGGGKPGSAGKKKGGKNANQSKNPELAGQDWSEWKKRDKEVVADQFKDDLETALLESKLQMEQKKKEEKQKQETVDAGDVVPTTREERKKKKQKEKAKPMSIEEFKQLPPPARKPSHSDESEGDPAPPPVHYRVPSTDHDSKFFNNVQNEAKQILRQDRMQEEYRKTYAADNAIVASLKNEIEIRDKTIVELKAQGEKMEGEMKQVKQRNKQLCLILAQGEMKDKAKVLIQVDELTTIKDELMQQVTTLTAQLEKEKSKNSALKIESDKLKASKHGK